jgi:hypothetical protein
MQLGYQELEVVCTFMSPISLGVVGGWKGNGGVEEIIDASLELLRYRVVTWSLFGSIQQC